MISQHHDIVSHSHPEFLDSYHADTHVDALDQASHHRVHTYIAHALILFNVYGVLLSSGLWLEYFFTSLHPTASLLLVSVTFSVQLTCFSFAIGATRSLYHRWPRHWRLQLLAGILSACGANVGLLVSNNLWVQIVCQGALTGLGLGACATLSTLALSTHYVNNIALASTQCVAAGFFGTAIYTGFTWACLRNDAANVAHGATLALLVFTLLPAFFLTQPNNAQDQNPNTPNPAPLNPANKSLPPLRHTALPLAILLLTPTCLLPPLFLPLSQPRSPTSPHRADTPAYSLFALATTALFSSALLPKVAPHRLSPSSLLTASFLLNAVAVIPLIWTPVLGVAVPCAAVFGVGLGGVCAVGVSVVVVESGPRGEEVRWGWQGWGVTVAGGASAGCVVLGGAVVLERCDGGVEILFGAVAACLGLGGLAMSMLGGVRYGRKKRV